MKKGYYGIGIYETKEGENVGTLWRSAYNFGADFIFTIGKRYRKQPSNTTATERHIPLFHFDSWDDFIQHQPKEAEIVFIEQTKGSKKLHEVSHPKQAVYILGSEDRGVPLEIMRGHQKVEFDTPICLNVAVAGSIVMYDRQIKGVQK